MKWATGMTWATTAEFGLKPSKSLGATAPLMRV